MPKNNAVSPNQSAATGHERGELAQVPVIDGDYAAEHAARISAEAAVFIRDRVLSIVSHDLRGPLNAIHSWAHVLERKLASEDAGIARAIAGIRTGVEQQVKLIEDVIDKTRAATRNLTLTLISSQAAEVVTAERDNIVMTLADDAGITIRSEIALGETPTLLDPVRFGQAVWTMLAYAVETSVPHGTVDLLARLHGGRIEVAVSYTPAPVVVGGAAKQDPDLGVPRRSVFSESPGHLDNGSLPLALPSRVAAAHDGELTNTLTDEGQRRIEYRHPARPVH